jgi:hypothetical protein
MSELTDDQIIGRLRSALDEVAAEVSIGTVAGDGELVAVRPIDPRPDRRSAWLGAAAVTVLLAGAAVWALTNRTEDPVTAPSETPPVPTTPVPTDPVPTDPVPTIVRTVRSGPDAPAYSIMSPRLAPGHVRSGQPFGFDATPVVSWRVEGDGLDGFIDASITDSPYEANPGDRIEPLAPPRGTARLLTGIMIGVAGDLPIVEWVQDDGAVWRFQTKGFSDLAASAAWIDVVFRAVPGSGVPIVLDDERATLVAIGTSATWFRSTEFTDIDDPAATVVMTIADGPIVTTTLASASTVRAVTVDGAPGWLGTDVGTTGQVRVIWDIGNGWWGSLDPGPELADQIDDIIATVVRVDESAATAPQYELTARVEARDGFDVVVFPIDSPVQAAYEISGFPWDQVDIAAVGDEGRRSTGPLRLVVRRDRQGFEFVELLGPVSTPTMLSTCASRSPELDALVTQLDQLGSTIADDGIVAHGVFDTGDSACARLTVFVLLDTPYIEASFVEVLGDLVDLRVVLTRVTP